MIKLVALSDWFRFVAFFILIGQSSGQVGNSRTTPTSAKFQTQVKIKVTTFDRMVRVDFGTGTLINDQFVLTAAHVIENENFKGEKTVTVSIQTPGDGLQEVRVRRNAWRTREEDIAVIMLEHPVGFQTADLPAADAKITDMEEINFAGFGNNDRNVLGNLLEGKALKLPVKYCELFYGDYNYMKKSDKYRRNPEFIEQVQQWLDGLEEEELEEAEKEIPQMICTGVRSMDETRQYPKAGDSGCGLFKTDDSFTVYGVFIRFDYRGQGYHLVAPAMWVKVSHFLTWIHEQMRELRREAARREGVRNNPCESVNPNQQRNTPRQQPCESVNRPSGPRGSVNRPNSPSRSRCRNRNRTEGPQERKQDMSVVLIATYLVCACYFM